MSGNSYSRTHRSKDPRRMRQQGQGRGAGLRRYPEDSREKPCSKKARRSQYERGKTENDLPNVSQVSRFASLVCPYCGETIKDITMAIASKGTGEPAHFDCVLKLLEESEPRAENEKIVYIGHGNFATVAFENPHNPKKFKISRVIEWEDKKAKLEWRLSILDYYDLSKPAF